MHFRYSAMNSGKTTEMIQVAHNYETRGKEVLLAKPKIDTKGEEKVVSRVGLERPVDVLIEPTDKIIEVVGAVVVENNIDCVLVDEGQFLQPEQVDDLYWQVSGDLDTPVVVFGLRADFLSVPFPGSERLLALADELEERATICRCGKKARFNTRMVDSEYVFEGEQVAIDGEGTTTYDSLCKSCYRDELLASTGQENAATLLAQLMEQTREVPSGASTI